MNMDERRFDMIAGIIGGILVIALAAVGLDYGIKAIVLGLSAILIGAGLMRRD